MSALGKFVAIFCNLDKPAARREVPRLKSWFRKQGFQVLPPQSAHKAVVAVSLGGDGTILGTGRRLAAAGVPVLGVNVGHLGFLAGTDLKHLYKTLKDLLAGRLALSERMLLSVKSPRGKDVLAVNDCVVRLAGSVRVIRLSAWVDGQYLATYVGDGLIVSTPTGSTAYSLGASGPIVQPETDVVLLTPICPHSLTQRPLILSADRVLEIRVEDHLRGDKVLVSLDGQQSFQLKRGQKIVIRRAQEKFRLFFDRRMPYFSVLRQKLRWGE